MDAREFLRTDVIVLTIVIYAAIGVAADAIARFLERRLLAWHPNYAKAAMTLMRSHPVDATKPAVVVRNLRRAYGERVVIDSLNLRIERGEFVALLGESGCGKTTLLRALCGLDPIDGGAHRRSAPAGRRVSGTLACCPGNTLCRNVSLGLAAAIRERGARTRGAR